MPIQYFNQKEMSPLITSFEKPVKEIMELNVKTVQGLTYLTPIELLKVKKPEEIIEKNVELFIENSHKALDYMQNMFSIMEKHWYDLTDNVTKSTQNLMNQTQKAARSHLDEAVDIGSRTANNVATHLKKQTKKNVKQAQAVVHKTMETSGVAKAKPKTKKTSAKKMAEMSMLKPEQRPNLDSGSKTNTSTTTNKPADRDITKPGFSK